MKGVRGDKGDVGDDIKLEKKVRRNGPRFNVTVV